VYWLPASVLRRIRLNTDRHTEYLGLERGRQVVLDHGVQPGELLVIVVSIHSAIGDQLVEIDIAAPVHRGSLPNDGSQGGQSCRTGCTRCRAGVTPAFTRMSRIERVLQPAFGPG